MFRKRTANYCFLIGLSVLSMWIVTILKEGIAEGPIEISFHLASEFLMAILLLITGIGLLMGKTYAWKLFLVSNGMLIYSVLNAAGYFGQRGNIPAMIMFLILFIISSGFLVKAMFYSSEKGNVGHE